MVRRVYVSSELKGFRSGGEAKASLNRAVLQVRRRSESESEQGGKLLVYDPKPGDLPMVRLKWK